MKKISEVKIIDMFKCFKCGDTALNVEVGVVKAHIKNCVGVKKLKVHIA